MSEFDAEWFTPDEPVAPRKRPRPDPTTFKPRRPPGSNTPWVPPRGFFPNKPRRPTIRPPHRRHHHDEADTVAPVTMSAGVVASISVISSLVVVVGLLFLLYFTVVRKKFTKKKNGVNNDFSIRVEDVAHINIEDSSNTYVNTKDLQRLVETIRQKPKEQVPRINRAFKFDITSPVLGEKKDANTSAPPPPLVGKKNAKPSAPLYAEWNFINKSVKNRTSPTRQAPPPPKQNVPSVPGNDVGFVEEKLVPTKISSANEVNKDGTPLPPILPKPKFPIRNSDENKSYRVSPVTPPKPLALPVHKMKNKKITLPLLKTNLLLPIENRELSTDTPETSESVIENDDAKPELLSLSQKKAMWESGKK